MGYFGAMAERRQYGRDEHIDYYKRYRYYKELAEDSSEQDDWAFEERDQEVTICHYYIQDLQSAVSQAF